MMLEKIKKNIVTILVCIVAILTIIEKLWKGRGGIKMILDLFPAEIDTFWLIISILGMIILLANYDKISKYGRKYNAIKSKYDKLVEQTKLPKTFDMAITVERSPDWGIGGPIIITNRYGKFPHLRFDMRVINRTYLYYKAEEAKAKCYCGSEEVLDKEGTWDSDTKKSETFRLVSNLPVWGQDDGSIMFHVPIKRLYDDMTTWRLRGKVKYKSKEPLIDDDNQYANPEIDIEIEYMLSEKQISELKKEVEKALGDEI